MEKVMAIGVIEKDVLSCIAATGYMVE